MAKWVENINELNNIAGNPVTDIYIKVADLQKAYNEQGAEGVRTLLNQNGLNTFANAYSVSDGISADIVTTSQSVLISEESATGLTSLNITNEIVDGVAYLKFSATPSTTYTEAGSATTLMDFKDFAAMVLTATGLSWERMEDYPEYWNTALNRYKTLGGSEQIAVDVRETASGTKIYANSKDIAAVTKVMAEQGSYEKRVIVIDDMPTTSRLDLELNKGDQTMSGYNRCYSNGLTMFRNLYPQIFSEKIELLRVDNRDIGENLILSCFDDKEGFYTCTYDIGYFISHYDCSFNVYVYAWPPNAKPKGNYNANTGAFEITEGAITVTELSFGSITAGSHPRRWEITARYDRGVGTSVIIYNKLLHELLETNLVREEHVTANYYGRPFSTLVVDDGHPATPPSAGTASPIISAEEAESETTGSIEQIIKDMYTDWPDTGYSKPSINPTAPGTLSEEEMLPLGTTTADPNTHGTNESANTPTQEDITENGGKPVDIGNEHSNSSVTTPSAEASTNAFNPYYPPSPHAGDKHPVIAYTGGRMFNAHVITKNDLDLIGSVFWTDDFLTNIGKFFAGDPLDTVIGCLEFFCDIPTAGSSPIAFGNNSTGYTYPEPLERYFGLPCGSVTIPTYYNDARDFSPFTKAEIYLPFIGWQSINAEDIVGATVEVHYGIDAFTGACVASIYSNKGGGSKELYAFTGVCGSSLPLTGSNHNALIASIINTTVGLAKSSVLGPTGALGSAVSGVANIATNISPSINRGGAFNGNSGAMGAKQPYIVITRKVAYDASSYNKFYGYPANITRTLGSVSGYTRVKEIHLDNIACTDDEKAELDRLLRAGIIL